MVLMKYTIFGTYTFLQCFLRFLGSTQPLPTSHRSKQSKDVREAGHSQLDSLYAFFGNCNHQLQRKIKYDCSTYFHKCNDETDFDLVPAG